MISFCFLYGLSFCFFIFPPHAFTTCYLVCLEHTLPGWSLFCQLSICLKQWRKNWAICSNLSHLLSYLSSYGNCQYLKIKLTELSQCPSSFLLPYSDAHMHIQQKSKLTGGDPQRILSYISGTRGFNLASANSPDTFRV